MNKIKQLIKWLYVKIKPYLHWKMLLVFGGVWIISTGIWYVIAFAPIEWIPNGLRWFARGYIGFLYLPTTPEKALTIPFSGWLYKKIFKEEAKIDK